MTISLWQTKLAARIHDPAEKALVLMRDPAGHEGGSIVGVGKALGFRTKMKGRADGSQVEKLDLSEEMQRIVDQADRWASAADRAQFPKDSSERYPSWAQVRFAENGELIHPLSGDIFKIDRIGQDVLAEHIKTASESLFSNLIHRDDAGAPDLYRTQLAFWRFGPELGQSLEGIGHLWSLLPADTRTPDHTIWQHLDLTSAIAGAMCDGQKPALLTVSLGPVQDFIAAGRSTSDLWAGSHFLSMMAWQAMKVVVERYGPDAILFPELRGVPIVDLWLISQGVDRSHFANSQWADQGTDYNPLFGAALPNKFVALVPEDAGEKLAADIEAAVRAWVKTEARVMLDRVLEEIGEKPSGQHCYAQLESQLQRFPEVQWSLVPWMSADELEPALASLYPVGDGRPGLFGSDVWAALQEPVQPEQGWQFWSPTDGMLYPAVHDAAERLLAAAKSSRSFEQLPQFGYRDTLTGELEWLTLDEAKLKMPSGQRKHANTLWTRVAKARPSWAKMGEHLSAFGLIKRLWPTRYVAWLKQQGVMANLSRYVVSTHAMALAPSLEKLIQDGPQDRKAYDELAAMVSTLDHAAMPRRLMFKEQRRSEWWETAVRLPTLIDDAREHVSEEEEEAKIESIGRQCIFRSKLITRSGPR